MKNIDAAKRLLNNLIAKIQSPENNKEIHFYHDPTGLGGQISRRVLAFRVGMLTGARVCFPDETMYPYDMCFTGLPASYELSDDSLLDFGAQWKGAKKFDFWSFWDNENAKNKIYKYFPDLGDCDLSGVGDIGLLLDGAIISFFELTEKYKKYVENEVHRISLPDKYIAVHFRRGDKSVETPYVPAKVYRQAIVSAMNKTNIKSIYIASDFAGALEELDLQGLGANIFFDKSERRLNNANHKFLMKNQNEAENETKSAIKNIEILRRGQVVIGQDNAHFATIAAAYITYSAGGGYYGELISGAVMLKKSHWRIIYLIKNTLKNVVKIIFPKATLKHK